MTSPERADEMRAHDALRSAIQTASLARWDKLIADGEDENDGLLTQTRPEIAGGLLVDYVVVAVYDGGQDHNVTAILRTDGSCPQYRAVGLLQQALADTL